MEKREFLNMAAITEGGLFFLAIVLGYFFSLNPVATLKWSWIDFGIGIAGIVPLFLLFQMTLSGQWKAVSKPRQFLLETIGPKLAVCTWYELLGVALLAGIGEEVLFRGFFQVGLELQLGPTGGWIVSNVIFGLFHLISLGYAIMAGIAGLYLGWLFNITGSHSLLIPTVTHGLYDFLAFLMLVKMYREQREENQ